MGDRVPRKKCYKEMWNECTCVSDLEEQARWFGQVKQRRGKKILDGNRFVCRLGSYVAGVNSKVFQCLKLINLSKI